MFHGFIPHIMGTRFDMLIIHSSPDRLNHIWSDITNELEGLDKLLNRFDPASEVARLNALHHKLLFSLAKNWRIFSNWVNTIMRIHSIFLISHSKIFPVSDSTTTNTSHLQSPDYHLISEVSPKDMHWKRLSTFLNRRVYRTLSSISATVLFQVWDIIRMEIVGKSVSRTHITISY